MARIVVSGYAIRHPLAGNVLAFLHHVLGLYRLGHEVLYVEESGWEKSCYDPGKDDYGDDPSTGLSTVNTILARHGAKVPVCYVNRESGTVTGLEWSDVKRMLADADLLLNVGGVCWLPEFQLCRRRALIDKDPLFTQVGRFGGEMLDKHHFHFTYGTNIGKPDCTIPDDGIKWLPTIPPVVPEIWQDLAPELPQLKEEKALGPFTTIGNVNAYKGVVINGEYYGQKDEEFVRFKDLPKRTSQNLELALTASGKVKEDLRSAGWVVRDGGEVSFKVSDYQNYIIQSKGEFSVAKNAYVKTRSGWFSDRSVSYLAAGRPVVLQQTGYSDWLTTDYGVLGFSTMEEAVDSLERIDAEYPMHCRAARAIANETFSYKVVLSRIVETVLGPWVQS